MCKKIFSLSIFFFACMMIVFSCCEAEEQPTPAPKKTQSPVITTDSKTLTYKVGEKAEVLTITASVTDGGTLSYQWKKSDSADGEYTPIVGEDKKDYTPDTSAVGTTHYKCTVTNTSNGNTASTDSVIFTVVVINNSDNPDNPDDPDKPSDNNVVVPEISEIFSYKIGEIADALAIKAQVTDGGEISYCWYKSVGNAKDFAVMEDVTGAEYTPDTSIVGTTYYKCTVTNTLDGKTASASTPIFTVIVIDAGEAMPPKISATANYSVEVNKKATITVTAESLDGGELSYKWSKSVDNESFDDLANEKSSSLIIKPTETGTFYYKCEVTNSVKINEITRTAMSKVVITVTVTAGSGNIDIDFN